MTTKLSFCVELNYDGYYELKAYDPNGSEIPARKLADFDFEKLNAAISNHDALVQENKRLREGLSIALLVRDTFKNDIEQGFRTKDKEFAVDLLNLMVKISTKE